MSIALLAGLIASPRTGYTGLLDWFEHKLDETLSSPHKKSEWPEWSGFKEAFISTDGRVIDHSMADQRTVSEGQAYALFLALVANDRELFDRLLKWTENNLSLGDLKKNLPAWHWGKRGNEWGIIDPNSASDADLWILYCLIEAGKIWNEAKYLTMADHLAQLIIQKETLHVQGVGLSILPGPFGFVNDDGSVKLNPSYVPPFMMARLASHFKTQKIWSELYLGSQRLLLLSVEKGLYPDWIEFNNGISNLRKTIGDYDAIRVYLWIAITPKSDPLFPTLVEQIKPFLLTIKELGYVPETWNLAAGTIQSNRGPAGFQYALLPAFKALGLTPLNVVPMPSRQQVNEWRNYGYYSGMLSLLSQGYMDKRYSFGDHGQLITSKSTKGLP